MQVIQDIFHAIAGWFTDTFVLPAESWYAGISNDFYQNLIYKDRYQFILNGLRTTLTVTFFAAIFGILLGVIIALMRLSNTRMKDIPGRAEDLYLWVKKWHIAFLRWVGICVLYPVMLLIYLCRFIGRWRFFRWRLFRAFGRWRILQSIASIYVDIIRGTPVVVQLMIIYFIILTSVRDKSLVAIIAFSVNSAAYVSEMVRGGILAVDRGQTEAGRSLGLSGAAAMLLIVMPQAVKITLPSLFNELIMLLKETAIVGIIGHMDLAKSADYIRSLTFSPFFPLMTMAIIYYVVVKILTAIFARIERRLRQGDLR